MSGPKSTSYSIAEERRLEEEALRRAEGRARAASERLAELAVAVAHIEASHGPSGIVLPLDIPVSGVDRASLESSTTTLSAAITSAEASLGHFVAQRRTAGALATLGDGPPAGADLLDATRLAAEAARREGRAAPRRDHAAVEARATRALASVGELPWSEQVPFDDLAARFAVAAPAERARLATEMEASLDAARRRTRAAANERTRAEELLAELLGYPEDEAAARAAALARRVASGSERLDRQAEAALVEVVAEARAGAHRRHARRVVADALAELGYDVGDDFATLAVGTHCTVGPPDRPGWGGYAVRARAVDGDVVRWHLVRLAGQAPDPGREAALEVAWCDDLDAAHEAAAEGAVSVGVVQASAPGEVPVLGVADQAESPATRAGRRRRSTGAGRVGRAERG